MNRIYKVIWNEALNCFVPLVNMPKHVASILNLASVPMLVLIPQLPLLSKNGM